MTKKYENMVQSKEPDFHTFSVSLSILLTHNRKSMWPNKSNQKPNQILSPIKPASRAAYSPEQRLVVL